MNPKLYFLLNEFPSLLMKADVNAKSQWGKMNFQQMIEHMSDSVRIANGKDPHVIITPAERLSPMKEFLMSEKEFRPNTKNILMGDEPEPVKKPSVDGAINELISELNDFASAFQEDHSKNITNPFFGELNFMEWINLLHKHARHHLKQFNLIS